MRFLQEEMVMEMVGSKVERVKRKEGNADESWIVLRKGRRAMKLVVLKENEDGEERRIVFSMVRDGARPYLTSLNQPPWFFKQLNLILWFERECTKEHLSILHKQYTLLFFETNNLLKQYNDNLKI